MGKPQKGAHGSVLCKIRGPVERGQREKVTKKRNNKVFYIYKK
jgi:hypothetical protein